MRRLNFLLALSLFWAPPTFSQTPGQFSGNVVLEFIADGHARLRGDLRYRDPGGRLWAAPAGIIVDGASIPRILWTAIGSPFTGNYLRASVIHDFYCDTKTRPWQEVHRVFFDAMISGGVPRLQANIMYFAVRAFGPRWILRTERVPGRNFSGEAAMVEQSVVVDLPSQPYDAARMEDAQRRIQASDLTPEQIEALADSPG